MRRIAIAGISAALLIVFAGGADAKTLSCKKMQVKGHSDPAKRQIQVFSKDDGVLLSEADNPGTNGASVHVYSNTDSECTVLTASPTLWKSNAKGWKYNNPATKNQAQISDGKLQVKLRSNVDFSVSSTPQGTVNATVQFGPAGERYCMTCTTPKKDDAKKYMATNCAAATNCDSEPAGCLPMATTTTTSTTTTTTLPGTVVGALTATAGRFNYNASVGLPAAEAACGSAFPGSHVCKYNELVATSAAALTGLKDTAMNPVNSFWAVDPARPVTGQCGQTANANASRWLYNTAHLGVGGDSVALNNGTGVLGALVLGGDGNPNGRNCTPDSNWVGCCQ